jgi:hypothetical protein
MGHPIWVVSWWFRDGGWPISQGSAVRLKGSSERRRLGHHVPGERDRDVCATAEPPGHFCSHWRHWVLAAELMGGHLRRLERHMRERLARDGLLGRLLVSALRSKIGRGGRDSSALWLPWPCRRLYSAGASQEGSGTPGRRSSVAPQWGCPPLRPRSGTFRVGRPSRRSPGPPRSQRSWLWATASTDGPSPSSPVRPVTVHKTGKADDGLTAGLLIHASEPGTVVVVVQKDHEPQSRTTLDFENLTR